MYGEADGLHESLQGTRNSQDFLGPHTNAPIIVIHPLPPINHVELGNKAHT